MATATRVLLLSNRRVAPTTASTTGTPTSLTRKRHRLDQLKVKHKPRLLSDNGPSYISGELAQYLKSQRHDAYPGETLSSTNPRQDRTLAPFLKDRILLENYYLPGELENQIQQFIHYYNHERYHESLNNLTPADVFYGRGNEILKQRQQIKVNTLLIRKQMHYHKRAQTLNPMSQTTP